MSEIWPSIVRTFTPQIAGLLVAWAAQVGFDLPTGLATAIVAEGFAAVYYAAVRWLELHRDTRWGRLLKPFGKQPGPPAYWVK